MSMEDRVWFVKGFGRLLHAAKTVDEPVPHDKRYRAYCGATNGASVIVEREPSGNGAHLFVCRRCHEGAMRDDGGIR